MSRCNRIAYDRIVKGIAQVLEISPDAGVDEDRNKTCLQELHLPGYTSKACRTEHLRGPESLQKVGRKAWALPLLEPEVRSQLARSTGSAVLCSIGQGITQMWTHLLKLRSGKLCRRHFLSPVLCAVQDMFQKVVRALAIITGEAARSAPA